MRSYIGGLRQLCEGHERVAAEMKGALGQLDSLSEPVREYHERSSWCRTSDPHSQASHMQELMTTTVLEPIARHLETRRELEARLGKAKKKDHEALLEEVATHAESLPRVMNSPFEALRRCQIDFMALGAKLTGGQAGQGLGLGDIEVATAMTERGRGLTGKTGYTPAPPARWAWPRSGSSRRGGAAAWARRSSTPRARASRSPGPCRDGRSRRRTGHETGRPSSRPTAPDASTRPPPVNMKQC